MGAFDFPLETILDVIRKLRTSDIPTYRHAMSNPEGLPPRNVLDYTGPNMPPNLVPIQNIPSGETGRMLPRLVPGESSLAPAYSPEKQFGPYGIAGIIAEERNKQLAHQTLQEILRKHRKASEND